MKRIILPLICFAVLVCILSFVPTSKPVFYKPAQTQTNAGQPYFLLLADIHLNTEDSTTKYGMDTGLKLWQNLLDELRSILSSPNPPEFILCLGDLPAHYKCDGGCYLPENKRSQHNKNIATVLDGLRELVSKSKVPLIYVPGNNDPIAGDYASFADSQKNNIFSLIPETKNPYPAVNVAGLGGIPPCMVSEPNHGMGYYAVKLLNRTRIIVLNSVIFCNHYQPVDGVSQLEAGNAEMKWLEEQLQVASWTGDKVYIAMHIPPGIDAFAFARGKKANSMWAHLPTASNTWQNRFLRLTAKYQNTIAGSLFAHTHLDEVRLMYDSTGDKATAVGISCPGISTQHFNNPGFKEVYFDPQTKTIIDFVTRYTNPRAKVWGNESYRFSDVYHCQKGQTVLKCLSAQNMDQINKEMDQIYMVKNGTAPYDTKSGLEVRFGQ